MVSKWGNIGEQEAFQIEGAGLVIKMNSIVILLRPFSIRLHFLVKGNERVYIRTSEHII